MLQGITSPVKVESQSKTAITAIKAHILHQNLEPGDPLPTESEMCESMGVSRTSLREAVRTLVALDIVEVRHGHGTFVGNVSMQPMVESLVFRGLLNPGDDLATLREIVEVRQALEYAFSRRVVEAWHGKTSAELERVVIEMEALADQGQVFPQEDRLFHSCLLAPLQNKLFRQLTEAFWDIHQSIAPRLSVLTPEDISLTARGHRAMLDAAIAGDVTAYRLAVEQHYQPLLRIVHLPANLPAGDDLLDSVTPFHVARPERFEPPTF